MKLNRLYAGIAIIAMLAGTMFPAVSTVAAQEELEPLPQGRLTDQLTWFLELLADPNAELTEEVVTEHFSPDFLTAVPADGFIASLDQIRSMLGQFDIGNVQYDSSQTQAEVQLVGDTGVVMLMTMVVNPDTGLIEGLLLQPDDSPPAKATAEASPIASPMASPVVAVEPPPSMEDVLPQYEAVEEELLTAGRDTVEQILAGESPHSETVAGFETSRVHFEFAEVNAVFDGQFTLTGISGFYHQLRPGSFQLEPDSEQAGNVPTGRWIGQISLQGGMLGIEVEFSGDADNLSATLDIPEQNILDQAMSNVSFHAGEPIGELVSERVLPMGIPTNNYSYTGAYE